MSGLCGWLAAPGGVGAAGMASDGAASSALASMAAPLSRFDSAPLIASVSEVGGVAVAAIDGSRHVYQQDGLQVAIWGRPMLDGSADDVASRLASLWLSRGVAACASLSGPFSLAILDAFSGSALLAVDRAGIHPLSYAGNAQGLFFASSHDALLAKISRGRARHHVEKQVVIQRLRIERAPHGRMGQQGIDR